MEGDIAESVRWNYLEKYKRIVFRSIIGYNLIMGIDDEYLLLAKNIVASCKPIEILLMLKSTATIKKYIVNEINLLDWCGMFLDCAIVSIDGRDGEYKRFVSFIADFFLDHLDIERFRKNLIIAANEKGYNIAMKENNV